MCVTFMHLLLVFIYIEVQTSQFHFSVILTQLLQKALIIDDHWFDHLNFCFSDVSF